MKTRVALGVVWGAGSRSRFWANMAAPAAFAESAHLRALVEWITTEVRILFTNAVVSE